MSRQKNKILFMKTTFRVILMVLVAAFYSCKNEDMSGVGSSITSDGVLSGTIVNNAFAASDFIIYDYYYSEGGECSVTTDGKFSMSLSTPYLKQIGSIKGVSVSDTTSLIGHIKFSSYKPLTKQFELKKCNYTTDSIRTAGMSFSEFIYADRAFTQKGIQIVSYQYGVYTKNETYVFNLKFKKGWNEMVEKVDSYSLTGTNITEKISFSNKVSSDLQWRYLPNYLNVNSNVKGLSDLPVGAGSLPTRPSGYVW
jgi:hypothetical protein